MTPNEYSKRISAITRHIDHVAENCSILGERLIGQGEMELGLSLIANGKIHDNSKFRGIEWLYLNQETKDKNPENFAFAVLHHRCSNPHHPEYWNGIEEMPRLYLGEFICDTYARSNEFGQNFREWIKEEATEKYKFTCQGRVYKELKDFIDLLLEEKFQ